MLSRKLFIQSETCRVVAHETGSGDSKDSRTAPYQTQDPYHPTRHPYHSPRYNGTATTRTVSPKGFDHLIFGKTQANIGDTFQETDIDIFSTWVVLFAKCMWWVWSFFLPVSQPRYLDVHSVVCGLNDVEELKIHGYIGPFFWLCFQLQVGMFSPITYGFVWKIEVPPSSFHFPSK